MSNGSKVSAKEQKIIDLRQKISQSVSAADLQKYFLEIVDILQSLQSENERLERDKMNRGEGVNGGTF